MTDRDALLAACLDDPADDTARLVLADWLDEHGEHERAAVIRHQVTSRGGSISWTADVMTPGERGFSRLPAVGPVSLECVFRRGFVAVVRAHLDDWLAHAADVLAAHPVERVEITDVPGLVFTVGRLGAAWMLRGMLTVPAYGPAGSASAYSWHAEHPTRSALAGHAAADVAAIVGELRDLAGERWPGPPAVALDEFAAADFTPLLDAFRQVGESALAAGQAALAAFRQVARALGPAVGHLGDGRVVLMDGPDSFAAAPEAGRRALGVGDRIELPDGSPAVVEAVEVQPPVNQVVWQRVRFRRLAPSGG